MAKRFVEGRIALYGVLKGSVVATGSAESSSVKVTGQARAAQVLGRKFVRDEASVFVYLRSKLEKYLIDIHRIL